MKELLDVNSGKEFTPSKAHAMVQGQSPCMGEKESGLNKGTVLDVNSGGYKEHKAKSDYGTKSILSDSSE